MLKIGVTGGIGSGKSIVCNVFKTLQIPVFEADHEAKKIIQQNVNVKHKLISHFGEETFRADGSYNTGYISKIIFSDISGLQIINNIVHPYVKDKFIEWSNIQTAPYVIEEAAILFESGADKHVDKVIMVYSEIDIRIERIRKRNGMTVQNIKKITETQMDELEKCKLADFTIVNNEKTLLLPQILNIHNKILNG